MGASVVPPPRESRSALLLGATGLVGRHCLERLLAEPAYGRVVALTRRPVPREHPRLEEVLVEFERLDAHAERFAVDEVFCCLGTTIRRAGSREAFRRVDLGYPREAARLGRERGAGTFLLVSAVGADPTARVFYNRVKGEAEAAVKAFAFRRTIIVRPSLLLGERDEVRPGERVAGLALRALSWLMLGPLARYRPIEAERVAAALVRAALREGPGIRVVESERIARVALHGP